jgi:hypothetical protein
MLPAVDLACPYCGEWITVFVDLDAEGDGARYVEDCQVCCRPIQISVSLDDDGAPQVEARADHEA